ncbi:MULTISPECIES: helix-turn-helix domain-containing protein [Microbacterium]|jgi:DNA-binding HxlR family transcriptional regulator|uniref:winged helix-turn-helix transcriptional regulator n=1 Tax=Microbacterium TaxID=33882 RepID=UPI0023DA10A8|nr:MULTISPECIES: helix-turn-helix domain-containing protein [Microbacterium]MDF2045069.1 helix-turn-helix domain-containing protein [Microbacterium sp. Kw_RZR3]MDF2918304.1 putative transcriptional regulator [Microbacterium sp.]MDQ1077209.1 DNA-binding HxlR family transcriptional regulator [Microbacterium sp. SORGH_AS_0969]MDQ1117453.1 DNA-binding HxlR family transcriptional regulator [Microbacterium testaceum]
MSVSLAEIRAEHPEVFADGCPTRTVLDHVMGKWGILVLMALSDGTQRWGVLRRNVSGISEKMLASTLKTFEADGLVVRTAYPEVPPRVEYGLTDRGRDLMTFVLPLLGWVAENAPAIVARPE